MKTLIAFSAILLLAGFASATSKIISDDLSMITYKENYIPSISLQMLATNPIVDLIDTQNQTINDIPESIISRRIVNERGINGIDALTEIDDIGCPAATNLSVGICVEQPLRIDLASKQDIIANIAMGEIGEYTDERITRSLREPIDIEKVISEKVTAQIIIKSDIPGIESSIVALRKISGIAIMAGIGDKQELASISISDEIMVGIIATSKFLVSQYGGGFYR